MDVTAYILQTVRKKKEFMFLDDAFILREIGEILRLNKKLRVIQTLTKFDKSKEVEFVIKQIRAKARPTYGIFQIPSLMKKRQELLTNTQLFQENNIRLLLQTHLSTKERMKFYPEFFTKVLKEEPKSVVDIACGLNPVAYYFFTGYTDTTYNCIEFSSEDAAQLNAFFLKNKLPAKAQGFDVIKNLEKISIPCDVCFLLKALDTLESQKRHITYKILPFIQAKYIIASFPMKNVKGKQMTRSGIHWFERMLKNMKYTWETILFSNEIVYIIK